MSKLKLKVIAAPRFVAQGQIHPFTRAKNELEDLGYTFVENGADYTLLQTTLIKDVASLEAWKVNVNTPIIILDDAASTGTHKFWSLKRVDGVVGYIKKQLLRDRELYKTRYPRSRYHYFMLSKIGDHLNGETTKDEFVDDDVISKIHLGWNSALSDRHGLVTNRFPKLGPHRNIDIHLSMKTKHVIKSEANLGKLDDHYSYHRAHCQFLIEEIAKKHKFTLSGKHYRAIYFKRLARSKICISAWGLGEICWRDYEAITHGSIFVKPDMSYLETWPDIYIPWETYVPVKADWSDLEDTILEVLNNYEKYHYIVENAFEVLMAARCNEAFASKFHSIMGKIL
jgi:hypothetical protein